MFDGQRQLALMLLTNAAPLVFENPSVGVQKLFQRLNIAIINRPDIVGAKMTGLHELGFRD